MSIIAGVAQALAAIELRDRKRAELLGVMRARATESMLTPEEMATVLEQSTQSWMPVTFTYFVAPTPPTIQPVPESEDQ